MNTTKDLLIYILGDTHTFNISENKIKIGDKLNRINILFSCSPNPIDHIDMFTQVVSERKPIVWIKDNVSDQLFRNHDLMEYLPNFENTITILSPSPEDELNNIDKYELPRDLFQVKQFDKDKILEILHNQSESISEEDKRISEISIGNLLESVLYQETFSFPNFLLG